MKRDEVIWDWKVAGQRDDSTGRREAADERKKGTKRDGGGKETIREKTLGGKYGEVRRTWEEK